MSLPVRFKRRIKRVGNSRCRIQALKLNHVCCCFTWASGLDSLFIRHTRLKDDIYPSRSLDRSSDVFVYFTSKVFGQTPRPLRIDPDTPRTQDAQDRGPALAQAGRFPIDRAAGRSLDRLDRAAGQLPPLQPRHRSCARLGRTRRRSTPRFYTVRNVGPQALYTARIGGPFYAAGICGSLVGEGRLAQARTAALRPPSPTTRWSCMRPLPRAPVTQTNRRLRTPRWAREREREGEREERERERD